MQKNCRMSPQGVHTVVWLPFDMLCRSFFPSVPTMTQVDKCWQNCLSVRWENKQICLQKINKTMATSFFMRKHTCGPFRFLLLKLHENWHLICFLRDIKILIFWIWNQIEILMRFFGHYWQQKLWRQQKLRKRTDAASLWLRKQIHTGAKMEDMLTFCPHRSFVLHEKKQKQKRCQQDKKKRTIPMEVNWPERRQSVMHQSW